MPAIYQAGVLDPLNQISFDNSQAGVNQTRNPVLIIGQTVVAQPAVITPMFSIAQCNAFAGPGSQLARLFQAYYQNDQIGPVYVLPLPDASGSSKATGSILFAGTAIASGTIPLYLGGQNVPVGCPVGTTAVQIVAAIVAACNAMVTLPVTAAAVVGTGGLMNEVQFTAQNGGTLGNTISIVLAYLGLSAGETLPAGLTATVSAMAGGASDPVLTGIAALLGDTPMRLIVHAYSGAGPMATFATLMNNSAGRWAPLRKSWGHVFTALQGLPSALASYGATNNDPHSSVFGYETGSPTPAFEAAGCWAGAMAASLRQQPNQPVQTLPLLGFLPPQATLAEANGGAFQKTTRNTLEGTGIGCARYDLGGPAISLAPTTYQLNSYGAPDQSYFATEDMFLLMAIADRIMAFETQQYARSMVADDGTRFAPQLPITTPSLFKAAMITVYNQMQYDGLVEDASAFIAASMVWRNTANPSELDTIWAPYLVVGLRQITNTVQFRKYSAAAAAAAQSAATS